MGTRTGRLADESRDPGENEEELEGLLECHVVDERGGHAELEEALEVGAQKVCRLLPTPLDPAVDAVREVDTHLGMHCLLSTPTNVGVNVVGELSDCVLHRLLGSSSPRSFRSFLFLL